MDDTTRWPPSGPARSTGAGHHRRPRHDRRYLGGHRGRPGLATSRVTEPPWTTVVWANRQVTPARDPAQQGQARAGGDGHLIELGGHEGARGRLDQRGDHRLVLHVGAEPLVGQLPGGKGDPLVRLRFDHRAVCR